MTDGTKTAHTPGPWEWVKDCGKWELRSVQGTQPTVLKYFDGRMRVHSNESGKPGKPTEVMEDLLPNHPDAALIAAAPDLLAALRTIGYEPIGESEASTQQIYDDIVQIARDAIAKATH